MAAARQFFALLNDTFTDWNRHKTSRLGAAMAYYTIFSFVPLLLVLVGLTGLVFGPAVAEERLMAELRTWVGSEGVDTVRGLIDNARAANAGSEATVLGFATLAFGAIGMFAQLQDALNTIWDVPPTGRGIRRAARDRAMSLAMMLGAGALLFASLVTSPALTGLGRTLTAGVPERRILLEALHLSVSFAGTTILFAMLYRFLPDARVRWRDIWPGAAVAAALFSLGRFLIALYLGVSTIGSVYGTAGSLVALLIWVYYSAQVFLLGAELVRALARRRGAAVAARE